MNNSDNKNLVPTLVIAGIASIIFSIVIFFIVKNVFFSDNTNNIESIIKGIPSKIEDVTDVDISDIAGQAVDDINDKKHDGRVTDTDIKEEIDSVMNEIKEKYKDVKESSKINEIYNKIMDSVKERFE